MKRFFIWLAEITGAAHEIRKREYFDRGSEIISGSYWYTDTKKYGILYPFLKKMGERMRDGYMTYGHEQRKEVDEMMDANAPGELKEYQENWLNNIK